MATSYTSLLGLALPVTGELSGTWGDTVNNAITSLLDTAVAGTTTLSADSDVTLTTTTGVANQARQAILLCSGARTAIRTITAPAQSKIYTVINATTGGYSVKVVGAGPTAGVTIVAGESAVIAWNGSDFIKISNTGGSASFTNVTVSGTTTLSGLTASTALALNASKEVVSVANTGTGNNVLSASPTLTGTVSGASLQLSSLTAGRVTYAGASGLLQDSANLTFNGTDLTVSGAVNAGTINATTLDLTNLEVTNIKAKDGTAAVTIADTTGVVSLAANPVLSGGTANGVAYLNGSKVLTTGSALTFDGTDLQSKNKIISGGVGGSNGYFQLNRTDAANLGSIQWVTSGDEMRYSNNNGGFHSWFIGSEQMRLTSTGLGIGTSSPGAKLDVVGGAKLTGTVVTTTGFDAFSAGSGTGTSIRVNAIFKGTDASGNARTSYIGTNMYGTDGSMEFSNNIAGLTMSIAPGGNVGIGTSSPTNLLTVAGSGSTPAAFLRTSSTVGAATYLNLQAYNASSAAATYASLGSIIEANTAGAHSGALAFNTVSAAAVTERMRIDSSGNVGIGTSSPGAKLHVSSGDSFGATDVTFRLGVNSTRYWNFTANAYAAVTNTYDLTLDSSYAGNIFLKSNGTTRLTLDSSGNLGLGVTPSAWLSGLKAFDIGNAGISANTSNTEISFNSNVYRDGSGNYVYKTTNLAARFVASAGSYQWYTAPSGTAGNAISFTQAMTLDSSGNLFLGATTGARSGGGARAFIKMGSGQNYFELQAENASTASGLLFSHGSTGNYGLINYDSTDNLLFYTASTERARIDSSGNVGIGTSSPGERLTVQTALTGTTAGSNVVGRFQSNGNGYDANISLGDNNNAAARLGYLSGNMYFWTNGAERMRLDTSGNLGLGVTPAVWTNGKAFQLSTTTALFNDTTDTYFGNNFYYNAGFKYLTTAAAMSYRIGPNGFFWYTAPSGTAGSAFTFTERMRLDSSGNLGLGVTPSAWYSSDKAIETNYAGLVGATGTSWFLNNAYRDSGLTWRYRYSNASARFELDANAFKWYIAPSGTAGNAISFTQAMTLDASGNLGVGTTSPSTPLHVYKSVNGPTTVRVENPNASNGAYAKFVAVNDVGAECELGISSSTRSVAYPAGEGFIYTSSALNVGYSGATKFYAGTAERMRIDSSGNLLVGTTSNPRSNKLYVSAANFTGGFNVGNGTGEAVSLLSNGTSVGSISVTGSATAYNTSSDYRLKENIQPMTGALAKVAALKPCTYKWKADGSDGEGFIAHELAEVVPQCVTGEKDAVDAEGKPVYQGIDTSFLVATLTAAIQEQQAIIDSLKARLDAANL